jgi:hypothetical protein
MAWDAGSLQRSDTSGAGLLVGFSAHHSGSDRRKSGLSWRMLKPTRMTASDHAAYVRRAASHHRCCIG